MRDYKDVNDDVINGMSALIRAELVALSSEYWTPHYSADQSETEMAYRRARIEKLRAMRKEFEDSMYAVSKE